MPYIAANPTAFLNQSVGTGQCVALLERAAGAPNDKKWKRGVLVRNAILAPGTIIATFDADGTYGNHTDGRSHAAIYLGQNNEGIQVIDQWVDVDKKTHVRRPHLASYRTIKWRQGQGFAVNDGDQFYVVQ